MNTPTEWTHRGHVVVIVKVGVFLTLIEYRDLFKNLHRTSSYGNVSCRRFRVQTITLELENDRCLAKDHTSRAA